MTVFWTGLWALYTVLEGAGSITQKAFIASLELISLLRQHCFSRTNLLVAYLNCFNDAENSELFLILFA